MDKTLSENWQNIEKLHCQNHWAKESQQKQENQESQRKILSLVEKQKTSNVLSELLSYTESRQKWHTQGTRKTRKPEKKNYALVGINELDKIVAEN